MSRSAPLEPTFVQGARESRRKTRTRDCRRCLILKALVRAGLGTEPIEAICHSMWLNHVQRRQILYSEGNRATHLYATRAGRVKLTKVDAGGYEHIVAILESGDLFGLEAVFGDAYSTSAVALTECEFCSAGGEELDGLMRNVPDLTRELARYLHQRLIDALARQACLGAPRARSKLACYILRNLLRLDGKSLAMPNELTHSEVGAILGLAPETICRTLNSLKANGIVDIRSGAIHVTDLYALRREAGA